MAGPVCSMIAGARTYNLFVSPTSRSRRSRSRLFSEKSLMWKSSAYIDLTSSQLRSSTRYFIEEGIKLPFGEHVQGFKGPGVGYCWNNCNGSRFKNYEGVATVAIHSPKIYSFEMLPSKWLLCTGGEEKAILWDIRKNQTKPYPVAELQGHSGPVKLLHMDSYKVVTGGPNDNQINVWETDSGHLANVLQAYDPPATFSSSEKSLGVSALAVDGCRLVISDADQGFIAIRDFSQCSIPILASPSLLALSLAASELLR
ncbi:hypothetical protein HPP92_000534 [Vanilla planifolia]|uniref:Uncharacterized protein n=1 Tax=Vanilla planifolia TaxID=51239 RepID=A0A835SBC8_VANPL|nr:hypothetical protein HPP92_000534 [Vanilla planifolia]